ARLTFRDPWTFHRWLLDRTPKKGALWVWASNLAFDMSAARVWEMIECGSLRLSWPAFSARVGFGGTSSTQQRRGAVVTEDPPTFIHARTAEGSSVKFCDLFNWLWVSLKKMAPMLGTEKTPKPGEIATDEDWVEYCANDTAIVQAA